MPDIAVLRGGKEEFSLSLSEGQEVLKSLSKLGYKPLDVLVDRDGSWTVQGMPTDAHAIFTRAHTVVDTTRNKKAPHIKLAHKMAITLMFSRGNDITMDREDMYRLLRMQGFKVPDTMVVRAKAPLVSNIFRDVWSTYHTPLMVRPLARQNDAQSKLITMYPDFEKTVRGYHEKGIDVHILTYRKAPTSSLAVLPNFRGEKLYTPLWVETFGSVNSIPSGEDKMRTHLHAPDYRKKEMRDIATKVYEALNLSGPACIDVVPYKDGYIVVNVDPHPSLRKDSRFMQSLSSTGVGIGEYIHSQIENEFLSNSPYKAFGVTNQNA
jgi:D-alanine-D-alanine ligase-like ATP-grasp enzyme